MGEGGAITTDDAKLAERAKRLRWMGIDTSTYERNYAWWGESSRPRYKWEYGCEEIGCKANMSDIQAAIGLVQLERLAIMQRQREDLYSRYMHNLDGELVIPFVHAPKSALHLMVIRCDRRDGLHSYLAERGISTGVHYKPIHLYPCYGYQKPLPVVEREWQRLLTLPLYPDLTLEQVDEICQAIQYFYEGD